MVDGIGWRDRLIRSIALRQDPLTRRLVRLAERVVAAARNNDLNPATNGEYHLLRTLGRVSPRVVFDVGANHGEWSEVAATALPTAAIHAFEIVPATSRHLAAVAGRHPAIIANAIGLSDAPGELRIHTSPANDKVSSILPVNAMAMPFQSAIPWEETVVTVTRGDAYCRARGITAIDVLKIDVEGAEDRVLTGFGAMLDTGAIGLIQFEYGLANIHSHHLLLDYYTRLGELGYRIGKLMPDRVAFKDYAMTDEDFLGPNYVAVHASRPDMIAALS